MSNYLKTFFAEPTFRRLIRSFFLPRFDLPVGFWFLKNWFLRASKITLWMLLCEKFSFSCSSLSCMFGETRTVRGIDSSLEDFLVELFDVI